jgi:hypothetical protein
VWVCNKPYGPVSHQVCGRCQYQGREIMTVPFHLHSELNVPMDTVQIVKELQQLA